MSERTRVPTGHDAIDASLAEIVDISVLLRLEMELKDVDGRKTQLFFYTADRGRELELALVQRGYTVAILYAERHVFASSEPGIRHEDPGMIKVPQHIANPYPHLGSHFLIECNVI